jgi:hypothetical protein
MKDILNFIIDFLKNKAHSITFRVAMVVLIPSFLIAIDYFVGFSNSYIVSSKLENLNKIELIKSRIKNNDSLLTYLNKLESSTLRKSENIYSFLDFSSDAKENNINSDRINKVNSITYTVNIRSPFWHLVSSSGIWFLVAIIAPFLMLLPKKKEERNSIGGIISVVILILAFALFFYFLFGLIPVINNNPNINYLINVVLQFSVFFMLYLMDKRKATIPKIPLIKPLSTK